jgi:hypothetical protein
MNHLEHEDGSPRRVATTTVWEAVRTDIAAAFASVAGPLPAGEHSARGRFLHKSFGCAPRVYNIFINTLS